MRSTCPEPFLFGRQGEWKLGDTAWKGSLDGSGLLKPLNWSTPTSERTGTQWMFLDGLSPVNTCQGSGFAVQVGKVLLYFAVLRVCPALRSCLLGAE